MMWKQLIERLAAEVDVEPDLDKAWREAGTFLNPILAGQATGLWNPQRRSWQ